MSTPAAAAPRITFVCNELGSFRHHRGQLAEAARRHGYEAVLYATPTGAAVGDEIYAFRPIRIERFRFHPWRDASLFATVFGLLTRERPDVLHLLNLKPYLFGGLAARAARLFGWRGRLVVTVPGLGRLYDRSSNDFGVAALRRFIVERFLRVAMRGAHVTFETQHDRDFWLARRLIQPEQATVTCGTGLDLAAFAPPQTPRQAKPMTVLFAGRLLRQKGIDAFLAAAARLATDGAGEEIRMRVAGFVERDPDAVPEARLRNAQGLDFLGPVQDMLALLRETDMLVLPSRYNEGVPRILIEAAACGCVPVATRFPGSEALIADGETGFFLKATGEKEQAEEIAALALRLKGDPALRQRIGKAAAAFVRDNGFSADEVTGTFLQLYGITR